MQISVECRSLIDLLSGLLGYFLRLFRHTATTAYNYQAKAMPKERNAKKRV
jgi:hypothetical protein